MRYKVLFLFFLYCGRVSILVNVNVENQFVFCLCGVYYKYAKGKIKYNV